MLNAQIDAASIRELEKLLGGNSNKIARELNTAIGKTNTFAKSFVAKEIGKELKTTQKNIKATIKQKKKSTPRTLVSVVGIDEDGNDRIPLKNFNARQFGKKKKKARVAGKAKRKPRKKKAGGVSYVISKTKGRQKLIGAFIADSIGGHVFKRAKGTGRLPIQKLYGPSTWGVYKKKKLDPKVEINVSERLIKETAERLRLLKLRKAGTI